MHDLTRKEILHYQPKPDCITTPRDNNQPRKRKTSRCLVMPPDPEEQDLFMHHSFKSARFCGIHEHCFRCFKGTSGEHGCAMAVPRGLKEATGPVELEDTTPKNVSEKEVQYSIRDTIRDSGDPSVGRNNVDPLDSVDRRIICWETRRPTLDKLPDLDETLDDEDCRKNILDILRSAMEINPRPHTNSCSSSAVLSTVPEQIINLKEQDLSVYNPLMDNNGFFRAVAVGMHVLGMELKSVGKLRGELMDHLASKADSPIINSRTTFGNIVRRVNGMSTEQYMLDMRDDAPHSCKAGSIVEILLLQSLYEVNIAVYKQDINDCSRSDDDGIDDNRKFLLSRNDSCITEDTFCGTIPLVDMESGHYKLICPSSYHPDRYLYSMNKEEIDTTIADLSSLQTSDLKKLYERVSDSLPDRNGWVAEFNLVLMAVMGCNTNSILLGCEEQSKSAAFYIGEMCTNLIVAQWHILKIQWSPKALTYARTRCNCARALISSWKQRSTSENTRAERTTRLPRQEESSLSSRAS